MKTSPQTRRKKVNFMIRDDLIAEMTTYIPSGERSDFVNEAIEEAIQDYKTRKAFEDMDRMAKKYKMTMSTEEFIKLKNEGRP